MQWTLDMTKALATTKERGDKKALKSMKKKQVRSGDGVVMMVVVAISWSLHTVHSCVEALQTYFCADISCTIAFLNIK